MAKRDTGTEAKAGGESVGDMVRESVRAYGRALEMSQNWSESMLVTLKDQAESYGSMLRSVDTSLRAMERSVKSQAETTKALAESLKASREVVDSAMSAHRHSVDRVETSVGGMLDVLSGQLQALRSQVELSQTVLSDPLSAQHEMLLSMTQDWAEAYRRLFPMPPQGTTTPR